MVELSEQRTGFRLVGKDLPDPGRGQRVLIVAHQVVVLCFRYLLEGLNEAELLEIDAREDVANCGVTEYRMGRDGQALELVRYNFVAPLRQAGALVTTAPDAAVAAR